MERDLKLTFITPLWTADATRKARYVEGTGLMGSLRWWYEVLIRGLGGWACDPSGEGDRCQLDGDGFKKRQQQGCTHAGKGHLCPECEAEALKENGLCAACQVFGATGWAKTFSAAIKAKTERGYPPTGEGKVVHYDPETGHESTFFFPRGLTGNLTLALHPRRPDDTAMVRLLLGLLELIRRNAALGAKTSWGYGLFEWAQDARAKQLRAAAEFTDMVVKRAADGRRGQDRIWPNLREMFFAEVELKPPWQPEDKKFVNFKCDLRTAFRARRRIKELVPNEQARTGLERFLLGWVPKKEEKGKVQASKIKMAVFPPDHGAHMDYNILRIWGWVPRNLPKHVLEAEVKSAPPSEEQQAPELTNEVWQEETREQVMELIREQVDSCGHLARWREFDSERDTKQRCTEPEEFLRSLMEDKP